MFSKKKQSTLKTVVGAALASGLLSLFTIPISAHGAAADTTTGSLNANGTPSLLDVHAMAQKLDPSLSPQAKARAIVADYADRFGLSDPPKDLVLLRIDTDIAGNTHVHFGQQYRGIPVEGSRLSVHFDRDGTPKTVTGLVQPNLALETVAKVTARQAVDTAVRAARENTGADTPLRAAAVDLVVFNTAGSGQGDNLLAYKVTVVGAGVREFVFIDAMGGGLLDSFTGIHESRNRLTYDMRNFRFYFLAKLERKENTPPVGDTDVDNAHDYAGDTYDWYLNAYDRDSIDGQGMTLKSYTHYRRNYQNAFWDGSRMTYGDGFPVDDVAAHEMTHGVTEHTANLVYANQSGALNESFSDIFGESVDQVNQSGTDTLTVKWLMGEDIPGIGAIRDMSDPPAFGDPDRVGSPLYSCGTEDHGGVHTNSGVPNKLYFLLADGGIFNGKIISSLGLTKAAAIHYQDLTQYLGPNATMLDHYNGLMQACDDLLGVDLKDPVTGLPSGQKITATDCNQVEEAGLAVELDKPVCP